MLGIPLLEKCRGFLIYWFQGLSWFLGFKFLGCLDDWLQSFLVYWFQSSLVSKFGGFKVSSFLGVLFLGFKVSWFRGLKGFTDAKSMSCDWKLFIPQYHISISCCPEYIDIVFKISKK